MAQAILAQVLIHPLLLIVIPFALSAHPRAIQPTPTPTTPTIPTKPPDMQGLTDAVNALTKETRETNANVAKLDTKVDEMKKDTDKKLEQVQQQVNESNDRNQQQNEEMMKRIDQMQDQVNSVSAEADSSNGPKRGRSAPPTRPSNPNNDSNTHPSDDPFYRPADPGKIWIKNLPCLFKPALIAKAKEVIAPYLPTDSPINPTNIEYNGASTDKVVSITFTTPDPEATVKAILTAIANNPIPNNISVTKDKSLYNKTRDRLLGRLRQITENKVTLPQNHSISTTGPRKNVYIRNDFTNDCYIIFKITSITADSASIDIVQASFDTFHISSVFAPSAIAEAKAFALKSQ